MTTAMTSLEDLTLDLTQELEIKAPVGDVYRSMIEQISHIMGGDGKAMDLCWKNGQAGDGSVTWAMARVICGASCK